MKLLHEVKPNETLDAWLKIIIGCIIAASAYPMFMTPHNIATGGLTGVAIILNYLLRHREISAQTAARCLLSAGAGSAPSSRSVPSGRR